MNVSDWKKTLIGLAASAALLGEGVAHAELVLYDKDGWMVKHDGRAQGVFLLGFGDAKPTGGTGPIDYDFDFLDNPPGDASNNFLASRFRSGWTGGRFDWHVINQWTRNTKFSAHLGVAYAISTQNNPPKPNNNWDIRNGYLQVEGPWGDVKVGRTNGLYTLGSIISTATMTDAPVGLGNSCGISGDGLGCYSSGYGSRNVGWWAGVFYTTPDLGGLKIRVAAMDPTTIGADVTSTTGMIPVSQEWSRTPVPHFQTLITYDGAVTETLHLRPFFNGFWQRAGQAGTSNWLDPYGVGGGLDVHIADFKIGAGGTYENGTALYVPLFGPEVVDGDGTLRKGSAFYAHALYKIGPVDLSAGYGQANLKRTSFDETNNLNLNKQQRNIYGGVQYHIGPLTLVTGINLLKHEWHLGNTQSVQMVTLGADFAY